MRNLYLAAAVALLSLSLAGCKPKQVEPAKRGQRGESCQARNDCGGDLACINAVCTANDFPIEVNAKSCDLIECSKDADCCGDRPMEAPAKCNNRDSICSTPQIPDCDSVSDCASNAECNGGTCGDGFCSETFGSCDSDVDCEVDSCNTADGFCTVSFGSCVTDADCMTANACTSRSCDCTNPEYDPFDPICTDEDCLNLCTLRCDDERCVTDSSCENDAECVFFGLDYCVSGACVECKKNDDCDTDAGETCKGNFCFSPCEVDEECPLFHACMKGECVETGCKSDIECVYYATHNGLAEDARLSKCLPSDLDPEIKECKVPCENDGACGSELQVCEEGYCKYIGCASDEQCRALLDVANEIPSDTRPYVPQAICRE